MTPTALLILLLGAALLRAAYQTQSGWLYVTGAATLALVAVSGLLALGPLQQISVRALPMAPCRQGDQMLMNLDIGGACCGQQLVWATAPASRLRPWWRSAFIPRGWQGRLVAEGQTEISWPAPRRGEFQAPQLLIQSAFPLGLLLLTRRVTVSQRYLVFPRGVEVAHLPWIEGLGADGSLDGGAQAAQGIQFRGVREQRTGDAWKLIHWPTSARRGQLHIKETEDTSQPPVVLYLDARRSLHSEETADHLVAVAATIAAWCEKNGRSVALLTQNEASPETLAAPYFEASWLARFQAVATTPPTPPAGAILLSPDKCPGWRAFASAFIHCPTLESEGDPGATVVCSLQAPMAERLGRSA